MGIIYPSGAAILLIRLEDGVGYLSAASLAALQARTITAADFARYSQVGAMVPSLDGQTLTTWCQPLTVEHARNGLRQADTLTMSVAFRDLPIPVKAIARVGVLWMAGAVSPEDYAAGITNQLRGAAANNTAWVRWSPDTVRFTGFSDEISEDHESGAVSIECRDLTGALLDAKVPPDVYRDLELAAPLHHVIVSLLGNLPGFDGFQVRLDLPANAPAPPILALSLPKAYGYKKGTTFRLPASRMGAQVSYWDLISDLCQYAGLVPILRGQTLTCTTPRNVFTAGGDRLYPAARALAAGLPLDASGGRPSPAALVSQALGVPPIRTMVYGSNLSALSFRKRFTRTARPRVEVASWSPGMQKPIVAHWPPLAAPRRGAQTPAGDAQERVERLTVRGVTDLATAERIAQSLYEEIGRAEYTGRLETGDLASFGGGAAEADLLDLVTGDPIDVAVAETGIAVPIGSYLSRIKSDPGGAADHLVARHGWSPLVAREVVQFYNSVGGLDPVLRTTEARYSWQLGTQSPIVRVALALGTYLRGSAGAETTAAVPPVRLAAAVV